MCMQVLTHIPSLSFSPSIIHCCDSTDTVVGEILDRISQDEDEGVEIDLHDVDQKFRMLDSHFIYVRMRVCVCVYMSVSTLGDGVLCDRPFRVFFADAHPNHTSILVVCVCAGVCVGV